MPQATVFDERNGVLHFALRNSDQPISAFLTQSTCQSLHSGPGHATNLMAFYEEHYAELQDIVERKVRDGSRIPVVVKAADF